MGSIEIHGIRLPIIEEEVDLAKLLVESAREQGTGFEDGDVLAVTCKIVSKSLGLLVDLREVSLSPKALEIASKAGTDPRFTEILLRESDRLLLAVPVKKLSEEGLLDLLSFSRNPEMARKAIEETPTIFLVMRDGMLWTDAGLDSSNHPPGIISIPPRNLDLIARDLRDRIRKLTGKEVAVVICDTEAFISGSLDIARGSYGMEPIDKGFGEPDLYGKPKFGGVDGLANEVCSAAALIMRQTAQGVPAAILRGLDYERCECGLADRIRRDSRRFKVIRHIVRHTRRVLGTRHMLKLLLGR